MIHSSEIACAILDLCHNGEYPSPGAVNNYLRTCVDQTLVYRVRRNLVQTGKIDLGQIEIPANQLGTKR